MHVAFLLTWGVRLGLGLGKYVPEIAESVHMFKAQNNDKCNNWKFQVIKSSKQTGFFSDHHSWLQKPPDIFLSHPPILIPSLLFLLSVLCVWLWLRLVLGWWTVKEEVIAGHGERAHQDDELSEVHLTIIIGVQVTHHSLHGILVLCVLLKGRNRVSVDSVQCCWVWIWRIKNFVFGNECSVCLNRYETGWKWNGMNQTIP